MNEGSEVGGRAPGVATRRRLARGVWRVVRPVLVAYLLVVLVMAFLETWLVYPVPPLEFGDWNPAGLDHDEVWFAAEDGTKLHGWFVPHPQPRHVLLYCHGNGEHLAMNADLVAQLRDTLEASVFIFDYRGYGHSAGRPDEPGCIADGLAAQRWLAERTGRPASQIVVMGRSLGGAVAIAVAARQGAEAVILENSFSRMTDVAAYHYPWLPVRWMMRNRYDSLATVVNYSGPVLQSHGTADDVVPIQFARLLFDAIPNGRKLFIEFPGLGHNDPPGDGYYGRLRKFLNDVAAGRNTELSRRRD